MSSFIFLGDSDWGDSDWGEPFRFCGLHISLAFDLAFFFKIGIVTIRPQVPWTNVIVDPYTVFLLISQPVAVFALSDLFLPLQQTFSFPPLFLQAELIIWQLFRFAK